MNLFMDTNDLVYLAKSGTSSDPFLGLQQLVNAGYNLITTDTVEAEATANAYPDAAIIRQWLDSPSNNVTVVQTGIPLSKNAGEQSLVEAMKLPEYASQSNTVLSSDGFWAKNGYTNVQGAVQTLNQSLTNGTTDLDDFLAIRSSMEANAPTTPGISELFSRDTSVKLSQLAYDATTNRNNILNSASGDTYISAEQASSALPSDESSTVSNLSKVGQALEEIAAADPELASNLGNTIKGLGGVGLVFMGYDMFTSAAQAIEQEQNGNTSGSLLTIEQLAARLSLGIGGAEVGATVGATIGSAAGPVGTVVGSIVGSIGGAYLGTSNANKVVNAINQAVQDAVNQLSQAASTQAPNLTASFGDGNLASLLTPDSSGTYQLPSNVSISENPAQFSAEVYGAVLTTNAQGDTSATIPGQSGSQVIITTSDDSVLSPGDPTVGTAESTGSQITFADKVTGNTDSATVLYKAQGGYYVIDGSTETGPDAGSQADAPIALNSDDTVESIAPPSTPSSTSVTIDSINNNSDGTQTNYIQGIGSGKVSYTQDTDILTNGDENVSISGVGDSANLNNANITLTGGAQVTVDGSGDEIDLDGDGINLTLNGNDDVFAAGSTNDSVITWLNQEVSGVVLPPVSDQIGLELPYGADLVVGAGNALDGGSYGVYSASGSTSVTNDGDIDGTDDGGVFIGGSGAVTNDDEITGANGVQIDGNGSVINAIAITATGGTGVSIGDGGWMTNGTGADIKATVDGVIISGATGTVTDWGDIGASSGTGVDLGDGGTVMLTTSASIVGGGSYGVYSASGSTTVSNDGQITGTNEGGVFVGGAGAVTNDDRISGANGVQIDGSGDVINADAITATAGTGVGIGDGGTATNGAGDKIQATVDGVIISGATGTVTDSGSIEASSGTGVDLGDGGTVTLSTTASVVGGGSYGVYSASGSTTVSNDGQITGTNEGGVFIGGGGAVTNDDQITGANGVQIDGNGQVINADSITATAGTGVGVGDGGFVTNGTGAEIKATVDGVIVSGAAGSVTDWGEIDATSGSGTQASGVGVSLGDGGAVTLETSAEVIGGSYGVYSASGAATVDNEGSITGSNESGVFTGGSDSTVTNDGSITGAIGVVMDGAGSTLTNSGTIDGTSGVALQLGEGVTLALGGGGSFDGKVETQGALDDTLELTGGDGDGIVTDAEDGGDLEAFGSLVVDGGADWTLLGDDSFDDSFSNDGSVDVGDDTIAASVFAGAASGSIAEGSTASSGPQNGTLKIGGALTNKGTISLFSSASQKSKLVVGGAVDNTGTIVDGAFDAITIGGALSGAGTLDLAGGGSLSIGSGGGGGTIAFGAGGGSIAVTGGGTLGDLVSGFGSGDVIEFKNVAYAAADAVVVDSVGSHGVTYAVDDGPNKPVATFTVPFAYTNSQFALSSTGGALQIDYAPALVFTDAAELPDSTTQTLTGTIDAADAGLKIALYDGATLLGTTMANSSGAWTANVTLAAKTPHVLTARATTAANVVAISAAQVLAVGGGETIALTGGVHSTASLYDTAGDFDSVYGSDGTVYLIGAQAAFEDGGDTVEFAGGSGDAASFYSTGGYWSAVNGAGGTVYLTGGQAQVNGGGDTVDFVSGSGNAVTVSGTDNNWDSVNGSGGTVYFTSGQANVYGGGYTLDFVGGSGDVVSLLNTGGNWDLVEGSIGTVYLTSAQAVVAGGGGTVNFFSGSGNEVTVTETDNDWDSVNGSGGTVYLTGGQAQVNGGGDTVDFVSGSGNAVTVSGTDNDWDSVNGSGGTVYLTSGQATVTGGGDTIDFVGGSGNAVTVSNTNNNWDSVNGSSGTVYLTRGQAAVTGGGNTMRFVGGSGNAVSLYATNGAWDGVNGSNGSVYLFSAQAGVAGSGDTINMSGTSSMTQSGASDAFVFEPAIGVQTINGFAASDSMQFSASDFANFAALQPHISQSGANTLISLDASDTVTLTGVTATSLTSSQFHFV